MDDDEINIDFSKVKKFFKKDNSEEKENTEVSQKESTQVEDKPLEEKKLTKEGLENPKTSQKPSSEQSIENTKSSQVEDDDEISLDFSKIKSIFKKKQSSESKVTQTESTQIEDNKDDDEISFDFSKIKSMFKKKESSENTVTQKESSQVEKENDEISFDFSKIKSWFSKSDSHSNNNELESSTLFFKKHKKAISLFLLILIPFFISVYLRAVPASLPITDDWATQTVYNNIQQQIANDITRQYPNLPQANINNLVNQEFTKFMSANKGQIDSQIAQVSEQFRSRLQKDGQTYLLAIDPYFWMRHADNILKNGHVGDELRDRNTKELCDKKSKTCVPWDALMYAPVGRAVPPDVMHAYFTAYFHKFMSIFNPNRDLMSSAFLTPIILASLCIIPAFFIARRLGGNFGGLIAALFVAIHPAFLTRTAGGFADTDAYNVLFPLLITWLFLEAFETKKWKLSVILSAVSGFLIALYITAWGGGWWYIFDFILASVVGFIILYALIHRNNIKTLFKERTIKHSLVVLFSLFISAMFFSIFIGGFGNFKLAFEGPMMFINLKEVGIDTVWPNVFTTVAEQNSASLNSIIGQIGMGSLILFLLAVLGISLTLTTKKFTKKDLYYSIATAVWLIIILAIKPQNLLMFIFLISLPIMIKLVMAIYTKNSQIDFKIAIILIIWFNATMFASTKGIRYLLLLVPAFSLGIGIAFGIIYKQLVNFVSKNLYLKKVLASLIVAILLLLFLIKPFNAAQSIGKNEIPSMNDAWYESLDKINREAEPDAIINSWWDFGHWFKAIGNRAVTFDGTSQNTPMAHWIGHALLTDDERKAIGILRMLDCGSNSAFNELDKEVEDTAKSVQLLHEVVRLDKKEAEKYLNEYIESDTTNNVLKFTHCEPPENYFITSDDMIGKSGVWAHFGSWDFDKALIYNTLRKQGLEKDKQASIDFMKNRFNYTDSIAQKIYSEVQGIRNSDEANRWIAPWPSYASPISGCVNDKNNIVCPIAGQGISGSLPMIVNFENKTANIMVPNGPIAHPNKITFPSKNGLESVSFSNNTIGYSVLLIPNGDNWNYIMSIPPLDNSVFSRLFFLEGHDMKHFTKFSDLTSVTGNHIKVWEIDWDGKADNFLPQFKDPINITE